MPDGNLQNKENKYRVALKNHSGKGCPFFASMCGFSEENSWVGKVYHPHLVFLFYPLFSGGFKEK